MRHNEGYRRPTRAWQPTDRQRQVLDALVEGKSNVDIGQRLGITVDGAKWHVGELLAQTGCEDRQALARWWQERRERRALGWWPLGFAVPKPALAILVLAVVVGAIAILGRDDDGDEPSPVVPEALDSARSATLWPEEAIEVLAKRDPAPETCEPRERLDLRIVSGDELRAQGLIDLGRVVYAGHCPLYVANRADRTVAWLGGGGYVGADFSRGRGFGPCCTHGIFAHAGKEYSLTVYAPNLQGNQFRGLIWQDAGLVKVERAYEHGTYLMLGLREWVEASPGAISKGPERRAALSSDGHLFMEPEALRASTATNWITGESIDVTKLTRVGRLPLINGQAIRNDCYANDGYCSVFYDNGPRMVSPLAGQLRCFDVADGVAYLVDSGGFRLEFTSFGGYKFMPEDCEDHGVAPGDALPNATYVRIRAFTPDGHPLSLVATRDGQLYMGEVALTLGCPCEPRN
ncbi:MAG TPA: helix-turn-helix transcriptional regulator [Dehalococcoidia bacterium]|nr:helix-turn-helix transcriptional regulator [Dehalococcoidia bacterium]